jgi:hypothetical protein
MNQGFTYIWALKFPHGDKKHSPMNNPHKVYFFKRRSNGNLKIYNPNKNLVNKHQTALNKLKNGTFTRANYNSIKSSVRNNNVRPLHMYIMVKNILRVRHAAQNAARRRFQAIANPSNKQIQSHQASVINHNKRIKQWNKFMNISKNLIKNVNNSNNTPNNLVTRYRKNLQPTNFPNKARRRNMIKSGKNGIVSYQVREGEGNRFGPGRGFEYYNSNGRLYNH